MAAEDRVREPAGDERADGADVVLRARGIEKAFRSWLPFSRTVEVLHGADLDARRGQVIGIVGANGSGKSVLMKILVGAMDADSGTVERSGSMGWCPQEQLLYGRLTVTETFRLFGAAYGMGDDAVADAVDRFAERFAFGEYRNRRIDRLSGGNRQKVNLTAALLHDPDVLMLDEPYTAFDWGTYQEFWELVSDLVDRGTAVVVISHLINEEQRFDAILELADGTLRPQGDHR